MENIVQNLYCVLATYIVALVIILSILFKILDRKHVARWAIENFTANRLAFNSVFTLLILVECVVLVAELLIGPRSLAFSVLLSATLFIVAAINKYALPDGKGCPCFGTLSMYTSLNGVNVSAVLLALTAAIWAVDQAAPGWFRPTIFCLAISSISATTFWGGLKLQSVLFRGEVGAGKDIGALLASYQIYEPNATTVLIFLSVQCEICMSFLRYLEGYSDQFGEKVSFLLFIDGMNLQENMKFGKAIVVADSGANVKREFRVDRTPSMIVPNGQSSYRRYKGLDACSLALTRLVIVTP